MSSETPRLASEPPDMVFAKTPKGRAEVAHRSTLLSGKQRSTLIMIDGQKRLSVIGALISEPEVAKIVDILLAFELVAARSEVAVSAAASARPADAARLLHIKSMMTRSAETYLGLMAAEVVRRVEQACDEAQLLSVLGHWHMAMRESKYGKDVAGTHLEQIKANFAAAGDCSALALARGTRRL